MEKIKEAFKESIELMEEHYFELEMEGFRTRDKIAILRAYHVSRDFPTHLLTLNFVLEGDTIIYNEGTFKAGMSRDGFFQVASNLFGATGEITALKKLNNQHLIYRSQPISFRIRMKELIKGKRKHYKSYAEYERE